MTFPNQRANGTPRPDNSDIIEARTDPALYTGTEPDSGIAGIVALCIGAPIAILVSFAIGSALVAGSLAVIRWSWDTIGQVLS